MIPQIDLEGYTVYGMCQYQGSLDYVVAIDENSQELRVLRLSYYLALNESTIVDYKVVDKEESLVLTNINVDCKRTEQFLGSNVYTIGILGQYFQANLLSNYYLAKFSTKYNLTEYMIKSNDLQTMEIPKLVKIDQNNKFIYVALEINKNKYHDRTVYSPGEQPPIDNSNVAIVAYSWTHGVRMWVTVVGDEYLADSFVDMEIYGGYLYTVVNSFSTKYSTNASQTDINYYRIRQENGFIMGSQTYGSPTDDTALDITVTYAGVFLLAIIGSPFQPHRYSNKQWQTQNSNTSIVIILMNFNDQIIEIEGYDLSLSTTVKPYPQRFFITRATGVSQYFIFITHRTNSIIDKKGGIFLTYITNQNLIYQQTTSCPSNCQYCNTKDLTLCLQCSAGYYLFQYQCYSQSCPDFSYSVYGSSLAILGYCKPCHYSCLDCTGPSPDQCSSCCENAYCGATRDRVPTLGQCMCPASTTDSNGFCNIQCSLNLQGHRDQMCYTQCPSNSYPELIYDGASAQEVSQFDSTSPTSCESYSNDLTFQKAGKGLVVQGPSSLQSMPDEFTISFWLFLISPTPLNTKSTFINAFNRVKIFSYSSSQYLNYNFVTGTSSFVQPTYVPANQQLAYGSWNYVTVSQREIQTGTSLFYEIQVALAKSNTGTVLNTGYSNNQPVVNYGTFQNIIYLGADSDIAPGSFYGYLKEVKIFNEYHSFAQIVVDQNKLYRLYSYDDPTLISYWKLSENYNSSSVQYTIHDYSISQESLTFSVFADPDYPYFQIDTSNKLSLCTITDVKVCRSLDYISTLPIQTAPARLIVSPTFILNDLSLTKTSGDQVWFMYNNTDCSNISNSLAIMNYSSSTGMFIVPNSLLSPLNLLEGQHYQVCYYIASAGQAFNLMQIYLAARPRTVDPQNGNIYNRTGNVEQWMTGQGDQAYGDIIRFMEDCDTPILKETEILRSISPSYDPITIFGGFDLTGDFYFCWYPVFIQDYMNQPYFEPIHNLKFMIQTEPWLDATEVTTGSMNEDMILFKLRGTFLDGDKFTMAWGGVNYSDCNPSNFFGQQYVYNHSYWPGIWMGYTTGIHGTTTHLFFNDELQACWQPSGVDAPLVFIRIKKEDLKPYVLRLFDYTNSANKLCPELVSFDPEYGSSTLTETDSQIQFNFKPMAVYPSKYVYNYMVGMTTFTNTSYGRLIIYRGAIMEDGTIVKLDASIFWANTQLDQTHTPDPFQQGDLICTQTGQCTIVLSSSSSKLKAGEVYYLSFFPYSFSNIVSNVQYFLFNDKNIPITQSAYDHLFFCRSFDIYSSNQLINGDTLVIYGANLLYKAIYAKYVGGQIQTDTFYTQSINLYLKVYNTDSDYCVLKDPIATVAMQDVTNSQFTISNLVLRECNEGQLFIDVEVVRGIKDQYGVFTYVRAEKLYNIELGTIGCDSSCKSCNGTTPSNCMLCSNSSYFLYMGSCYQKCPSSASFYNTEAETFQSLTYYQNVCLQECPFQYYPDPTSGQCLSCKSECQTCNSSDIASCLSCNPVAYLFNGICISECPSPHHVDNYTDYVCHQVSDTAHLKVKIQSLGFLQAVPKDRVMYLKADIDNTGGGSISSITWSQIEPDATVYPTMYVFSSDTDGSHSYGAQIVKINNNGLMKILLGTVIKVMVRVNNTLGETQYDIYEFYLNDSPIYGNISTSFVGEGYYSEGTAMESLLHVSLTNWYDTTDDKTQKLRLHVYIILTESVGVGTETTQLTLSGQLSQNDFYLRLPPLSNNATQVNVSLCVSGEDKYSAVMSNCKTLYNVQNKLIYTTDYNYLVDFLEGMNLTGNLSNVLLATQVIYRGISSPLRKNSQPHICTIDAHCTFNGVCEAKTGVQKCVCVQGYYGTYCQFKDQQLEYFQQIATQILYEVVNNLTSQPKVDEFGIEIIGNVVRGLCNAPDLIDDDNLEVVISLMEMAAEADLYSQNLIDSNITQIVLEAFSNIMMKISHSKKSKKAMPDNSMAAEGYSILDYSLSQISANQSSRRMLSSFNQESIFESSQSTLIGGKKKMRRQLEALTIEQEMFQDWGRRIDLAFHSFVNKIAWRLDPGWDSLSYSTTAFALYLKNIPSTEIGTDPIYIQDNDAFWTFPSNLFYNQQGLASSKQEVKIKLIKYINNPFAFEVDAGAQLEQNITSVQFLTQGGSEIPIDLTGTNQYVDQREPFLPSAGFSLEGLKCMIWDEEDYSFVNDDSCGFSFQINTLPQTVYNPFTLVTTQVSQCRCSHLTRFGVVYEMSSPLSGTGRSPGIYSNFYAMAYWRSSFGIYITIGGIAAFVTLHVFIYIIDQRLQKNLIIQLKEKVRKFEIQYGSTIRKLDGMYYIPERQQKNVKKRKPRQKQSNDDQKGLLKNNSNEDEEQNSNNTNEGDGFKSPAINKKKKLPPKKKFQQDQLNDEPDQEASIQVPVKGKRPILGKKAGKQKKGIKADNDLLNDDDSTKRGLKDQEEEEKANHNTGDGTSPVVMGLKEGKDDFPDYLTEHQKKQLKNQKEVFERIKKAKDNDHLMHILMKIEADEIQGMTKKEFRKTIMKNMKKFKGDLLNDLQEQMEDLCNQLNSTDEEIYLGLKHHFKEEEQLRLEKKFELRNMVIEGSHVLSLFFVTSILCPRHVRWSLGFGCVVLLWFITAVIFNNTQNALQVPDFSKAASSQAISQLWIGVLAPFGSMLLMYIVSSFLKMDTAQILYCSTNKQLDQAIYELKKEMRIRFALGYGILMIVFGAIFWYVIKFTSNFGWKISWIWFYCGFFAICLQFLVLDILISVAHYYIYRCNKRLGSAIMIFRRIKQAQCEILKNPFEEEEEEEEEDGKKKRSLFSMFKSNKKKARRNSTVSFSRSPSRARTPKTAAKKKTFIEENHVEKLDDEEVVKN